MCTPTYTLDVSCVPERVLPNISRKEYIKPIVDIPFEGRVFFLFKPVDLSFLSDEYRVMVVRYLKPEMISNITKKISGIIAGFGGLLSHGATIAREQKKGYLIVEDPISRFFFGDYLKYRNGVLKREEVNFFTSGEPPYPTEPGYKQYVYRYSLALSADWIIAQLLGKKTNLINLFGETYALNLRPSEYYQILKNGTDNLKHVIEQANPVKEHSLEYIIFLHLLQRVSFAIYDTQLYIKMEKDLVYEDFLTQQFFREELSMIPTNKLVEKIFESGRELLSVFC